MGIKTKIDWCDSSWNPVTGCAHGCEYCYARKIAERFSKRDEYIKAARGELTGNPEKSMLQLPPNSKIEFGALLGIKEDSKADLSDKVRDCFGNILPYPFGFSPTFHRYRLGEPQAWKKPRNIFVCSMADLFGDWVPGEWIQTVFEACLKAPQHRYLFLTKNPKRYNNLAQNDEWLKRYFSRDNFWFGTSSTTDDSPFWYCTKANTFVSIEPILERIEINNVSVNWVIVGAETGNRKNKVVPEKSWIDDIAAACKSAGVPLFMKESLRGLMGDDFVQEFPWEAK